MRFTIMALTGFLFGIGFGYFVQRGGLCFAHGLGELFIGKGRRIIRLFLVIFIITGIGFVLSSFLNPALGLKPVGEIRGYGFYNVLSGMLFGAGILLNGGCILGTLRQIGEGHLLFVVVLAAFIPGMAIVVFGLDPWLASGYHVQKIVLPQLLNAPATAVTGLLALGAFFWLWKVWPRRR
ncbi:MAG: hypothetical protein EOM20_13110 [Spartobacteria bacterium]|nr:hypothetical protein [Spartobacteria bacterium]